MMSYSNNDSTPSPMIAGDLGIRLNFYMDVYGRRILVSEALIGLAIGAIEAGMCNTVVVFRAMNGYSQVRIGGTGVRARAMPIGGDAHTHGAALRLVLSAGQNFSPSFMRHMYDYGTTPEQVAMVKVIHSEHASNNPKAYYKQRLTVDDVVNSPHDRASPCTCSTAASRRTTPPRIIVTSGGASAYDYRNSCPRASLAWPDASANRASTCTSSTDPISTVAGYYIKDHHLPRTRGWARRTSTCTGAYDAFTFTSMLQLEDYGFCEEGGRRRLRLVSGIMRLGNERPNNTSRRAPLRGLHARDEHDHREHVRQLRGEVDDYCPTDATRHGSSTRSTTPNRPPAAAAARFPICEHLA